ncbi:MAG: MGMT family protein [Mariniblastus sp.]|nr:MGMT family protein [Mariniblastus sp.]
MKHKNESRLLPFSTELGWIGILHHNYLIEQIKFGFTNQIDLYEAFEQRDYQIGKWDQAEREWVEKFKMFAQGRRVSFASLDLELASSTRFQRQVLECCRKIAYGETVSYGQLAEMAGFPRAARAVGSTMRRNQHPLVIPCHRVVASAGIGGFSSPQGVGLKQRLLRLEGHHHDFH